MARKLPEPHNMLTSLYAFESRGLATYLDQVSEQPVKLNAIEKNSKYSNQKLKKNRGKMPHFGDVALEFYRRHRRTQKRYRRGNCLRYHLYSR